MEKKDNFKNVTLKVCLMIAFAFLLIYVISNALKFIKTPTEVFIVKEGEISSEESIVGYVIRDEIILEGENYKNGMIQIKNEGERVGKGEDVFRYYSKGEEDLKAKILELDKQITEALENETDLWSSDIAIIEKQIDVLLSDLYSLNDIQKINEYTKNINSYITKKSKIAGELSTSGTYISQLIHDRSAYEEQLHSGSEMITAKESGIVSYRVDGYEEVFGCSDGCSDFSYLNTSILENLDIKTGSVVESNNEKGKIVNNFTAYIAIIGESERALETKVNDRVRLRLSNLDEITAKVVYVGEESENKNVIVFQINDSIEYLVNYRKISLDIIWWSNSGKKVANSSIIEDNDLSYVIINRAGYLEKILVKVLRQNEIYSIVDSYEKEELEKMGYTDEQIKGMPKLKLYDEISLNPTKEMLQ